MAARHRILNMDLYDWNSRTEALLGSEGIKRLQRARVFIAGVGGVGGYAAEMLARSGVGHLTLADADVVSTSNLNRQLIATIPNLGKPKTDLFKQRFESINPELETITVNEFLTPENIPQFLEAEKYDFVIDAIDTVAPKVTLITHCLLNRIPIISSMGAGGRVDPTRVEYADLWETKEDGLARAVRQRLKKSGVRRPLRVVASSEAPRSSAIINLDERNKRSSYGTLATIPALFGIYLASFVIKRLTEQT